MGAALEADGNQRRDRSVGTAADEIRAEEGAVMAEPTWQTLKRKKWEEEEAKGVVKTEGTPVGLVNEVQ